MLKGCSCGGRLFFFIKKEKLEDMKKITEGIKLTIKDKEQIEQDIFDLVGSEIDRDQPVILDLEAIRVLRPGKDLVVSVPRYLPECICWALSENYHRTNNGHIRIYKKKELTSLLEGAGVREWAVHFAHSLHTPYWWLKCLVGPNRDDSAPVNLYHRFLVWDMMKQPWITRMLDRLLNPMIGKSLVIYLKYF